MRTPGSNPQLCPLVVSWPLARSASTKLKFCHLCSKDNQSPCCKGTCPYPIEFRVKMSYCVFRIGMGILLLINLLSPESWKGNPDSWGSQDGLEPGNHTHAALSYNSLKLARNGPASRLKGHRQREQVPRAHPFLPLVLHTKVKDAWHQNASEAEIKAGNLT